MPTKVNHIVVKNLRAINLQTAIFKGCTAIIIGGNDKGKSTLTKALIERFRSIKNDSIVREGQTEGSYTMELTNGERISWSIDHKGKEKLLIITSQGQKQKVTKEMMQYYFPDGFDVDKFLNDPPSKQRKVLEKLSGLDFSEVDKQYERAIEDRKYANKRFEEEKAREILFEPHWKDEEQDLQQYEKELQDLSAHNLRHSNINEKLEQKKKQLAYSYKRIQELKGEIEALEQECMQLETEIDKGTIWIKEEKNQPKSKEYKEKLQLAIEDIRKNNEAVVRRKELQKAEKNADSCNFDVMKILQDKEEMIKLADMPEGFSFSLDGVLYNGFPFDKQNQSTSALYIAALKLASRTLGEVKVIPFDASYLDKNSLKQVMEWAENNNLQLLIERPDFEGSGEIRYEIIEDEKE